jgi:hypothetical protein
MSRMQQGSLLRLKRKAGPDVWVFRWYDETNGARTYRKRTLGTVFVIRISGMRKRQPMRFATHINSEFRVPETVSELVTHYCKTS